MATWHITVSSTVGAHSRFQGAIHALVLKSVAAQFESLGFTIRTMPEFSSAALSVSHTSASAITLYLLQYGTADIHIQRVV